MYFHKIDHPYNFLSSSDIALYPGDNERSDFLWVGKGPGSDSWIANDSSFHGALGPQGLQVQDSTGQKLLESHPVLPFGTSGTKWMFSFSCKNVQAYYGMGEKNIGFEKSGKRTKFWNTDVWADFPSAQIETKDTDPMYASFPVLLVYTQETWVGLIVETSYPSFIDTGAKQVIEGIKDPAEDIDFFYLGASGGQPKLWITATPHFGELVARVSRFSGLPSRFPLWALGYHQSRWGYGTLDDLETLDSKFASLEIPCDGLWLDIDYMHEYRVFTLSPGVFDQISVRLSRLRSKGRQIVPILDPGLKREKNNPLVQSAIDQDLLCHNANGQPYVGFVWPGATYFPDFSLGETREWWANRTQELASHGFSAFWVDMNDPSTGSSMSDDMLFGRGTQSHESYHNDYGRDMTRATFEGLRKAYPDRRPFVMSRSGSIGSSKWGALWTGDNLSNYFHLQKGIEMVLSLSISGMSMVGVDICGFGGDCWDELALDWYRAGCLFPIFRNHSADGTRAQEPWQFSAPTLRGITQVVRTRYTFLPYLYQQHLAYTSTGQPILRPMIYDRWSPEVKDIADQFFIGEDLFQAPKLKESTTSRRIFFPTGLWTNVFTGTCYPGSTTEDIDLILEPFPLYARVGVPIPIHPRSDQLRSSQDIDLKNPWFLLFLRPDESQSETTVTRTFEIDAPDGWDYLTSTRTLEVQVSLRSKLVDIRFSFSDGQGPIPEFYVIGEKPRVMINGRVVEVHEAINPIPGSSVKGWK
jgi:alpha-glucosidase